MSVTKVAVGLNGTNLYRYLLVAAKVAVGDDGTKERRDVAEGNEAVEEDSGCVTREVKSLGKIHDEDG